MRCLKIDAPSTGWPLRQKWIFSADSENTTGLLTSHIAKRWSHSWKACLWIHLGKVQLIGSRCRLDMVGKEEEEEEEEEGKDTRRKLIGKFYSGHSGRFHIFSATKSPIDLVCKNSRCSCETMTCRQAIGWVLLFDGAPQAPWPEPVPFPERKRSQSTFLEFVEIWTFCFLFSLVCMFWEGKRH